MPRWKETPEEKAAWIIRKEKKKAITKNKILDEYSRVLSGVIVIMAMLEASILAPFLRDFRHVQVPSKEPAPVLQLERRILLPGEGQPVILPTSRYLDQLTGICTGDILTPEAKPECTRSIEQIRIGQADVSDRINPIYGRTQFTEEQLRYIRWGEGRVKELLDGFRHQFISS